MAERLGYCIVSSSPVRVDKDDRTEMVTQLLFGEPVSILEIEAPWCKIKTYTDNYEGYADIKHLHFLTEKEVNRWLDGLSYQAQLTRKLQTPWGTQTILRGSFLPYGNERKFNIGNDHFELLDNFSEVHFPTPFDLAMDYLNTPYMWGGKSPFGIDCSGLTQVVFRLFDINLPRDASQQAEYGTDVSFEEQERGDVAFFVNNNNKVIHVGILDGEGSIIHASGFVRRDAFTSQGIIHSDSGQLTHQLHSIKRM